MEKKKIVGEFDGSSYAIDIVVGESFAVGGLFACGYHVVGGAIDGKEIDQQDLEVMDAVLNFVSNKMEEADGQ